MVSCLLGLVVGGLSVVAGIDQHMTDHYYIYWDSGTTRTQSQSNDYCSNNHGTTLAAIHSGPFQTEMLNKMAEFGSQTHYWIGLEIDDNDRSYDGFTYKDGTSYDYCIAFGSGEPNDYGGNENCVSFDGTTGKANDAYCGGTINGFVCNRFQSGTETDSYYVHWDNTGTRTMTEANDYCFAAHGTRLGSVHSSGEEDEIVGVIQPTASTQDNYWIGMQILDHAAETCSWTDGTDCDLVADKDFISWYGGEPNNYNNGGENCVQYQAGGPKTNDVQCGRANYGFVCNRVTPGEHTCQDWMDNGETVDGYFDITWEGNANTQAYCVFDAGSGTADTFFKACIP